MFRPPVPRVTPCSASRYIRVHCVARGLWAVQFEWGPDFHTPNVALCQETEIPPANSRTVYVSPSIESTCRQSRGHRCIGDAQCFLQEWRPAATQVHRHLVKLRAQLRRDRGREKIRVTNPGDRSVLRLSARLNTTGRTEYAANWQVRRGPSSKGTVYGRGVSLTHSPATVRRLNNPFRIGIRDGVQDRVDHSKDGGASARPSNFVRIVRPQNPVTAQLANA